MGCAGAIGVCGSGKSFHLQGVAALTLADTIEAGGRGWRLLILDPNGEWPGAPADAVSRRLAQPLSYEGARDPIGAHRALRDGALAVIVRPPEASSQDKARELADACAWVAIEQSRALPGDSGVLLVLPEVHEYAPEGRPLPRHLHIIVHRHRHKRVGLLYDTQQFQDVKNEVLRGSDTLWIFAQGDPTSLARVKTYGGDELVRAVEDCAARLARAKADGRPEDGAGYHVEWDTHLGRSAPDAFTVRRVTL